MRMKDLVKTWVGKTVYLLTSAHTTSSVPLRGIGKVRRSEMVNVGTKDARLVLRTTKCFMTIDPLDVEEITARGTGHIVDLARGGKNIGYKERVYSIYIV